MKIGWRSSRKSRRNTRKFWVGNARRRAAVAPLGQRNAEKPLIEDVFMITKPAFFQKFPLDFWVCAVIFLFSAILFMTSRGYPNKAILFPSILLVCMMGLSVYCMAISLIKRRKILWIKKTGTQTEPKKASMDIKAVCIFGGMSAAYAFFTPYAGFGLTSLIFIGTGTVFFGEKDKRAIVAIPLATMLFVYGFFIYFLDVNIPFFPAYFSS
ncbi:MAG: tripartite tricarboxylate transporter TctB family protein [Azoarcus sp.]|jgi:hypothetical protein|nr:tripartite tricarboxylate transporter TctB family protein [Azoarcus sp.]